MDLAIVILAAGQGKRMRSHLPKVLHPIGGRPMLTHVLDAAKALAPRAIQVVVGHGAAEVQATITDPVVEWVTQPEQLGTGHAVQCALPYLRRSGWVLILNGDVPLVRTETLQAWLNGLAIAGRRDEGPNQALEKWGEETGQMRGPSLSLLTTHLNDPKGYGRILRGPHREVRGIREESDTAPHERAIAEVFTGTLVARRVALEQWLDQLDTDNTQGELYLTDIVGSAAAEGGGGVATYTVADSDEVRGVNDRIQLAAVEALYQERVRQDLMKAGATLLDPARTALYGCVTVQPDVTIHPNCQFEGEVILESGVTVGPNCFLKDCHLGTEARIKGFSYIEGARIGSRTEIGPYAHLRSGTVLDPESQVGNFVEIKKSHLGSGVKANHLSYIGDTEIGARTNIGAGTITCNYDGWTKHRTVIGEEAFIGSATQLVAPVTVGDRATIGAGSTITHDAPANALTLGRAKQATRYDWKRPKERNTSQEGG